MKLMIEAWERQRLVKLMIAYRLHFGREQTLNAIRAGKRRVNWESPRIFDSSFAFSQQVRRKYSRDATGGEGR